MSTEQYVCGYQDLRPETYVALLGRDLAAGSDTREEGLSRIAETLMALRSDVALNAGAFVELEESGDPLLPKAIGIVTRGILTSAEEDVEQIPTTVEEAIAAAHSGVFKDDGNVSQRSGQLLRVFLIGLEKGGYNRRRANAEARAEIEGQMLLLEGHSSYTTVADLNHLMWTMDTAGLARSVDYIKYVGRLTQQLI